MEDKISRRIYFIFSQGTSENNSYQLEKNEIINKIEILKQEKTANYSYTLYSISFYGNNNQKVLSILLKIQNEYFTAQLDCNKIYPEIFIYKIDFKPIDKNTTINLNQITLPMSEQFIIFKNHFLNDKNLIKYLLLNSFYYVATSNKKIKFEFYFFLFLFSNALGLSMENSDEKMISTFFNFFDVNLIDVENSYKNDYFKNAIETIIGLNIIEILSDINMAYTIVSSLISDEERNKEDEIINQFELLLAYYYINYNKKLFVKLLNINENPRYELTSNNLIKNRKIFKNFSSEILNFFVLDEAVNLMEIHNLFLLAPDIPELIKIMSDNLFFIKLCNLSAIEKKIVNVFKIVKPKKEDDIKLLIDNYAQLCNIAKSEDYAPFNLVDELFISYCDLFYQRDLNKIELIVKLYKNHCETFPKMYKEKTKEELYNYYNETGIFLIKERKLINKDLLSFLVSKKLLFNKEIKVTEEISKGLIPSNDSSFVESLINPEDKSLIELNKYYFKNFTLKDFLNSSIEKVFDCTNNLVIKYCFEGLKNSLLKEKGTNINIDLKNYIARLLYHYFNIYKNSQDIDELKKFEDELNDPKLIMDIFGLVILNHFKRYYMNEFKKHIYEYIESHYMEVEYLGLYYKALIIDDEDDQDNFLLNNLSIDYAIKIEDFIDYPNIIHPRIYLFGQLYKANFFLKTIIQNTEYYKSSINSKNNITSLSYKYALNIMKNGQEFFKLFIYFIPNRQNDEEDYIVANILFEFNDQVDYIKNKYNSLKIILNYFKHFFQTKRKTEITSLIELIQQLDDTPIKDFNKFEIKIDSFLVYFDEAEKNDRLFNSFFFMGIYRSCDDIFSEEEEDEKFKLTLSQFDEIKELGIHSDIDLLSKELINQLVELIYKNKDRLDDELEFIMDYFNFEDNPIFDYNRIKKSFLDKVNNYQINQNLGDYQIEFDDFNLIGEKKEVNNNLNINKENSSFNIIGTQTKQTDTNDGGFSLFEGDSSDFYLFSNNDKKKEINEIETNENNNKELIIKKNEIVSDLLNEEQIKELLKDFNLRLNDYYYIYRILKDFDDIDDAITYNDKYYNFFWEMFMNINKYDSLSNKQFYEEIIIRALKVFLSGVGINYFQSENNRKNDLYLIYEFYEILELYKKYNLLSKEKLFKIIQKLVDYKENENGEAINIIRNIENIFIEIGENIQKKSISNLFIKILSLEKNIINTDEFNHKLIVFTFRNDNNFLFNDIIPFLDEIFKEDIKRKINVLDDFNENHKYINFSESKYDPIEKALNNSKEPKITKDLEEVILYYFESKIMYIFSIIKKELENRKDFFINEDMKNNFKKSLFILEEEFYRQLNINNKKLSLLFNIAFIKCFLSDYAFNLFNFNQEMGNMKEINESIIKGNSNNPFRTMIKLYVLKLFYNLLGNYPEFIDFNYGNYQIYYFQEKEIKNLYNPDDLYNINNPMFNIYGFDDLFLPIKKNEFDEFISIEKNMVDICQNKIKEKGDLIMMINHCCNIDIFLCSIINIFLSNYKSKYYFQSSVYKNISSFLYDNITNDKLIRIKNMCKDILLLFIDKNKYENNVLKNESELYGIDSFSYNQILSITVGLRFVFNTLLKNNQNSILYQILLGNENILTSKNILIKYYNSDFTSYKARNINQLTFTIIKYIIFSHIYFGFLLKKITMSNIDDIFHNLEENIRLIDILESELNFIRKILALKGIKNIIIFMNYIFNDIKSIIVDISQDKFDELILKEIETKIENEISKYLESFSYYIDEYNKMIVNTDINNDINKNTELKKIIIEEKKFYNENNVDKNYPFIKYLTITNFCGIEDFKNQFLYLINDKLNYPLINCLINNDDIITISKNIVFINEFFNEINNELMLKIRSNDIEKTIGTFLNENIKDKIKEYNEKINEINTLKCFKMENKISEINSNNKIIEVINIKDNSINKMFCDFINIYNNFLTSTKIYKDHKNIIEPIIIQEATKNDFIDFNINRNQNKDDFNQNKKSVYERLNELLYLYSKRNRYQKNELNVHNKGKIIYDLNQIENILEKEYLYGKKTFKLEQNNFIFSNEVFSNERNNLLEELINNYPQEEIKDEMMKAEIDRFLNDENKTKNDIKNIYISLQYIILFLMNCGYNYNEDINGQNSNKINLDYIAKTITKKNYQLNELLIELFNNYKDNLRINNLLFLYEKTEIKYFPYLIEEIEKKDISNLSNMNSIEDYFKKNYNDLLLNEKTLMDGIKKYIMRYYFGDNQEQNEIISNININKIFKKKSIWHFIILNKEQEKKFEDETNSLINLNEGENNYLIKYLLKKLFELNKNSEEKTRKKIINEDELSDDEDEEENNIRKRRRRRKVRREFD